jgi:D-alanyl-D-alanine carboxypeptidase/D-alanyl-D-alanine-endopeptidase (penicillin-binding protein 4)
MKSYLALLLLSVHALAQDPATLFRRHYPSASIGPIGDQAFCAEDDRGTQWGYRAQVAQRIASVTKLFTTLVALDAYPAEQRWGTRFTLAGTRLHISGSGDPWFEEEKVLGLIEALQRLGVMRLDEVTFDEYFHFIERQPLSHYTVTIAEIRQSLARFFTPGGSVPPASLALARTAMQESSVSLPLPTRGIPTMSVRHSSTNPLATVPDAIVFRHESRPLKDILKAMNVYSKNKVAQHLWANLSHRIDTAAVFTRHGIPANEVVLRNGSGLAVLNGNGRFDNTATCRAVLKMLAALELLVRERGLTMEEVVGVGTDLGSYEKRFLNDATVKAAVVAKTGTLRNTSSLAGWIEGSVPFRFAILNHPSAASGTKNARNFQDRLISLWMRGAGPAQARPYSRLSIYALEGDFLHQEHAIANWQ